MKEQFCDSKDFDHGCTTHFNDRSVVGSVVYHYSKGDRPHTFYEPLFFNNNLDAQGKPIDEIPPSIKLCYILSIMKDTKLITTFKEFAEAIGETAVGLNDLKTGRKKLSFSHIKKMNIVYPFINTEALLFMGEGFLFQEDYLIKRFRKNEKDRPRIGVIRNHLDENTDIDYEIEVCGYDLDIKKCKEIILQGLLKKDNPNTVTSSKKPPSNPKPENASQKETQIKTLTELIKSKDDIIYLQKQIISNLEHRLKNHNPDQPT